LPDVAAGRAAAGRAAAGRAAAGRAARASERLRAGVPPAAAARTATAVGWVTELLVDLGLPDPRRNRAPLVAPRAEVIGSGIPAQIAVRIAERVRAVYGLSHTLAAPLRTGDEVIGAIVIARRDRESWPEPARRLLEAAADEAAAALARAYTYRAATANASTDPLTGLPNRRYFDEFCGLLARRRRSGDAVAVLMVDIDKFKALNDTHGHPVGDQVLRAVAGAIVTAVREEDVPARVGGEEFAVLLRNPGPEVAAEVGERVRAAVRALDLREIGVPGVTVSVGVANARGADEPITDIVDRADQALYRAKRAGRNRVVAS
jgi:diguanylate cyclase (GGDEF)-like protein